MEILVYIGTALAVAGLVGLIVCIIRARRLKNSEAPAEEIQAAFQRLAALNMGAFFLSILGLMAIVMGLFLS